MRRLLLLSNSTMPGTPFFTWPRPFIQSFLGKAPKGLVFIPFAAVTFSFDEYAKVVSKVFAEMGYSITGLHTVDNKIEALKRADAIVVGGGNTFALLQRAYQDNILEMIKERVSQGIPYIGWSAGANFACPTIMTTNDMPVVQPPSFAALDLVPFQINPHYHELKFESQGGETRKERLMEFIAINPKTRVVGLPEGMALQCENDSIVLKGEGPAKLYEHGKEPTSLTAGSDLAFLLND